MDTLGFMPPSFAFRTRALKSDNYVLRRRFLARCAPIGAGSAIGSYTSPPMRGPARTRTIPAASG